MEILFESRELEDERRANYVIHTGHIYSVREKKPKPSVILEKTLPLFSQKFTHGLATSDTKGMSN